MTDRACAGWGKLSHPISSGLRDDKATYVMYHMRAYPGTGAVLRRDGSSSDLQMYSLEGEPITSPQYGVKRQPLCRIVIAWSGGGGWRDPLQKDPARVRRDVKNGIIDVDTANRVYVLDVHDCE